MKLSLGFICTTLSLVSATASTAPPTYPDSHREITTTSEVLSAYTDLTSSTLSGDKWDEFCDSLVLHVPILAKKGYALDAELLEPVKALKYTSILLRIQNVSIYNKKQTEMIITVAKRYTVKNFYQLLSYWLSPNHLTTEQIHQAYQQIIGYMEWEKVIFAFTQSSTADKWKACLEEVYEKMENSTVADLIKIFEKWMSECDKITTFPTSNLNQLKDSVALLKSTYLPLKIDFFGQKETVSFFLDYLVQINIAYPNAPIQFDSNGNYSICCQDCSAIHSASSPPSTNCNVWNATQRYFSNLKIAIALIYEKQIYQYYEKFNSEECLYEKIDAIFSSHYFLEKLDEALSGIELLSHPNHAISYIRLMFFNLAYELFNMKSFSDYVTVNESIYCALLRDKIDELSELKIADYSSLSVRSSCFRKLIEAIPGHYHRVKVSAYTKELLCNASCLYQFNRFIFLICQNFHKYLLKGGEKITPKRRRLDDSINFEKCIDCGVRIGRNNPLVHPICDCKHSFIHVRCYLKKIARELLRCPECGQSIAELTEFDNYIEDYDISYVDNVEFKAFLPKTREDTQNEGFSDEDESSHADQKNFSLSDESVARIKIVKERDWKSEYIHFQKYIKRSMIKMSMAYLKESGESLKDFLAGYDNDIPAFIKLISPYYYDKVIPCTEAFLRESVFSRNVSQDSDFAREWNFFLENCWKPLKVLTEKDILNLRKRLKEDSQ